MSWRVVFMVGTKALFDGKLSHDATRERDRDRILDEMIDERLRALPPLPMPARSRAGIACSVKTGYLGKNWARGRGWPKIGGPGQKPRTIFRK
jgi:hypothetical protein